MHVVSMFSLSLSPPPSLKRVILDRSIGKLGLSIVGGADHVSRVFGQGRPGVYVSKVSASLAAARSSVASVKLCCLSVCSRYPKGVRPRLLVS